MIAITDYEGTPLDNNNRVFDFQEGKYAILHLTEEDGPWLEWEDGEETILIDPSLLVKVPFDLQDVPPPSQLF